MTIITEGVSQPIKYSLQLDECREKWFFGFAWRQPLEASAWPGLVCRSHRVSAECIYEEPVVDLIVDAQRDQVTAPDTATIERETAPVTTNRQGRPVPE